VRHGGCINLHDSLWCGMTGCPRDAGYCGGGMWMSIGGGAASNASMSLTNVSLISNTVRGE
jgi:hypothetical protein